MITWWLRLENRREFCNGKAPEATADPEGSNSLYSAIDRAIGRCVEVSGESFRREARMAVRVTRSAGMLLLAIWLILTGIAGFAALPIPGVLMAAVALIAGLLILIGM
jgi:hypothetical protein